LGQKFGESEYAAAVAMKSSGMRGYRKATISPAWGKLYGATNYCKTTNVPVPFVPH